MRRARGQTTRGPESRHTSKKGQPVVSLLEILAPSECFSCGDRTCRDSDLSHLDHPKDTVGVWKIRVGDHTAAHLDVGEAVRGQEAA